jgi:hypothetical protein
MTQRLRNMQTTLGAKFCAAQSGAVEGFGGFNMSAYKSADQTVTSSTTFVDDLELWTELPGGRSRLNLYLPITITAATGFRLQFVADQGLVVNSIRLTAVMYLNGTAPGIFQQTAINGTISVASGTAWTNCYIDGTIDVQNQGVLKLQFTELVATAAVTIQAGASFDTIQLSR